MPNTHDDPLDLHATIDRLIESGHRTPMIDVEREAIPNDHEAARVLFLEAWKAGYAVRLICREKHATGGRDPLWMGSYMRSATDPATRLAHEIVIVMRDGRRYRAKHMDHKLVGTWEDQTPGSCG